MDLSLEIWKKKLHFRHKIENLSKLHGFMDKRTKTKSMHI